MKPRTPRVANPIRAEPDPQKPVAWEHRLCDHPRNLVAVLSDAAGLDALPDHRDEHLEPELMQPPHRRQILLRFGQHDVPWLCDAMARIRGAGNFSSTNKLYFYRDQRFSAASVPKVLTL
jgi:hypothetical protein